MKPKSFVNRSKLFTLAKFFIFCALPCYVLTDEISVLRTQIELQMEMGNLLSINETGLVSIPDFEPEILEEEVLESDRRSGDGCPNSYADNAVLLAAAENDIFMIECLLSTGRVDLNKRDDDGNTALMLATYGGHVALAERLIDSGAIINGVTNNEGNSALLMACFLGHSSIVKKMVEVGASIESRDFNDNSALVLAAAFGYGDIVDILLASGADVNAKNNDKKTAAELAATFGFFDIVTKLTEKGAESVEVLKSRADQELSYEALSAALKAEAVATEVRVRAEKEAEMRRSLLVDSSIKQERESFDTVARLRRQKAEELAKQQLLAMEAAALLEERDREEREAAEVLLSYSGSADELQGGKDGIVPAVDHNTYEESQSTIITDHKSTHELNADVIEESSSIDSSDVDIYVAVNSNKFDIASEELTDSKTDDLKAPEMEPRINSGTDATETDVSSKTDFIDEESLKTIRDEDIVGVDLFGDASDLKREGDSDTAFVNDIKVENFLLEVKKEETELLEISRSYNTEDDHPEWGSVGTTVNFGS